ncbi:MAG TPA: MBL fold metallo-hydrolase [Bacteroidetes bacterium]|nr:MBL fold metallo-hydrolase [Bacteroidota bacterium]
MRVNRLVVGPFAANCYIVNRESSKQCVIIDPGGDAARIKNTLADLRLQAEAVLLTHGHIDHLFALAAFSGNDAITVIAHEDEKVILAGVSLQSRMFGLEEMPAPEISRWVHDNDMIQIAEMSFRVIHTPGHSPGGCCFFTDAAIFVGDTLFDSSIGRTDLPGGNYDHLIHSIRKKLFILPDDTLVYPGHGEQTTIGREKKFNPFLRG